MGAEVHVGGQAAATDLTRWMNDRVPWVVDFVLVLTFVVMLVSFGSPALAAATIALNTLSVGAAYGLMNIRVPEHLGRGGLSFTRSR